MVVFSARSPAALVSLYTGLMVGSGVLCLTRWNMYEHCGGQIDGHGGELYFAAELLPFNQMSCSVTVAGNGGNRTKLSFFFSHFNIGPDCTRANVTLRDGPLIGKKGGEFPGIPTNLCTANANLNANQVFTTTTRYLGITFDSIRRHHDSNASFTVLFTSYAPKESGCLDNKEDDVYMCVNGRCILKELTCQGLNPCGDFTTDCDNTTNVGKAKSKNENSGMSTVVQIIVFGLITVLGVVFLVQFLLVIRKYGRKRCDKTRDSSDDLADTNLMNGHMKCSIEEEVICGRPSSAAKV